MTALVVVAFGDPPSDAALAALGAKDVLQARDAASPADLLRAADAAERWVLWLPAWAHVSAALVAALHAWRVEEVAVPRVARVQVRLGCGDGVEIGGGTRLLLASPGAATLDGEQPSPSPAARVDELAVPLEIHLPDDLTRHLEGVNEQSSVAARLRHAAGREATWSGLAWRPALVVLRALASASGSRRVALPHAVIEGYREVLSTAKLWELANGTALG